MIFGGSKVEWARYPRPAAGTGDRGRRGPRPPRTTAGRKRHARGGTTRRSSRAAFAAAIDALLVRDQLGEGCADEKWRKPNVKMKNGELENAKIEDKIEAIGATSVLSFGLRADRNRPCCLSPDWEDDF